MPTTTPIETPAAPPAAPPRALRGDDALDALERALIQLARVMIRAGVPDVLVEGEHIDRAGYWTLVRLDEAEGPVRLSDLAASMELDLSTVSRQARHLVEVGLVTRQADPDDGRAARLALSERGREVLESVRRTRRDVLRGTLAAWGADERSQLAASIARLVSDMQGCAR
ncbi:MAG TPA: MarR family transcriptional regulator [Acidimicrobiales bacterium]|nr:MarR family transcriptional regulator [Acidimicrobiales bacterium]